MLERICIHCVYILQYNHCGMVGAYLTYVRDIRLISCSRLSRVPVARVESGDIGPEVVRELFDDMRI